MGQGTSLFFNVVSAIFIMLTLLVLIVVISVAGGTMDAPFLAPEDTQPPPTIAQPLISGLAFCTLSTRA